MFPQISDKELENIENHFSKTQSNILEELSFNGKNLPCDVESGIFYLPMSMMDPQWGEGTVTSGTVGVEITFFSHITEEDKETLISSGKKIPFYAYTENEYRKYHLVITGLPILEITTIEEPPEAEAHYGIIENAPDGYYHMRLLESESKLNWVIESDMLMHVRGNTSQTYPKKGYKFQMVNKLANGKLEENKQSLLGYRTDDEWILHAMYNDGTKVRDKLSSDIWNAFGAKNNDFEGKLGTDMTYIEVVWDGKYHGLYALLEPVDSKQVKLAKEEEVHYTEYMYKKTKPKAVDYVELLADSGAMMRMGYELKGGKEISTPEDWRPLLEFTRWLYQESDEAFVKEAEEHVDLDSTVDMWLFANAISGFDQIAKNVYYIAKNVDGEYRFYYAPWDMDLTWGYSSDPNYPLSTKYEEHLTEQYVWWDPGDRMMETNAAGVRELAQERWKYLRDNILTDEWLLQKIDELEYQVTESGALARDARRWPKSSHDQAYDELRDFAIKRMAWMDEFMKDIEASMAD